MNNNFLQKFAPHFAALVLFIIITFTYLSPLLEGKQLLGHDTESWMGMAKETVDYNNNNDDVTLWTNSMFGGMPTYQILANNAKNLFGYIERLFFVFPNTAAFFLLYFVGFYILLLSFKVNPWLAIVGSIAFTFASYNLIIITAGHNSKAITMAYMAPLIGSVYWAFRRNRMSGSLLTALFVSLAVRANHIQILYYTLIILLFFGVVELVYAFKEKQLKAFFATVGFVLAAAIVGVAMNATALITTYEYSQYTMRGKSNGLTAQKSDAQHGLNKDYITQWSYGVDETMTLLIPNFKGGASGDVLDANSHTAQHLRSLGVPNVDTMMRDFRLPLYWGTQPFTSGPVYLGAIIMFLFVLGLFLVDRRFLWWLVPMIALTVMLSWGRNFMWLTDIFIDYVPMYNKFRTVSMTLVAAGFGITLIALLALKEVLYYADDKKKLIKPITISAAIVGGIALIFALIPSLAGSFSAPTDAQQFQGDYAFLNQTLVLDRKDMLVADAWRSVGFVLAAAALLYIVCINKIKTNVAIVFMGVLFLLDLVPVAKRYLNDSHFDRKRNFDNVVQPTPADKFILQDKAQFRVLDATVNIFNDSKPSYFHHNIGGYHAAKLRRYQELINMHIEPEIGKMFSAFGRVTAANDLESVLDSLGVLNMLNMKYVIYNKEAQPLLNPYANGNAWLVQNVRIAQNADEEMLLLGNIDTKTELVVDKTFESMLPAKITADSTAVIVLVSYKPNHLKYKFSSATDQLAVFSEIYYDKGWNAYINGAIQPYFRANYLLRAMPLKAGDYEIEFRFEPKSYSMGNAISLIASILLLLLIGAYFLYIYRNKQIQK